jgi:hypothetical protein
MICFGLFSVGYHGLKKSLGIGLMLNFFFKKINLESSFMIHFDFLSIRLLRYEKKHLDFRSMLNYTKNDLILLFVGILF